MHICHQASDKSHPLLNKPLSRGCKQQQLNDPSKHHTFLIYFRRCHISIAYNWIEPPNSAPLRASRANIRPTNQAPIHIPSYTESGASTPVLSAVRQCTSHVHLRRRDHINLPKTSIRTTRWGCNIGQRSDNTALHCQIGISDRSRRISVIPFHACPRIHILACTTYISVYVA